MAHLRCRLCIIIIQQWDAIKHTTVQMEQLHGGPFRSQGQCIHIHAARGCQQAVPCSHRCLSLLLCTPQGCELRLQGPQHAKTVLPPAIGRLDAESVPDGASEVQPFRILRQQRCLGGCSMLQRARQAESWKRGSLELPQRPQERSVDLHCHGPHGGNCGDRCVRPLCCVRPLLCCAAKGV